MNIRETIEKWEQETLSPYASLSANTRGRERTALRHPARVSARSRPYSAQQIVPASETENAGFSGAGGRPLPDAPDAHAGSIADSAHDRESAAAE